ncbi:Clp protease N-terminal domain-containing protein [Actinomycetospora lutea]|uniref:Clp protease N-terminal domain-containing protein n=1 Tax=Actinomycetospora lutea TaxID=663604 RepID=UPI003B66CCEF
MHAPHGGLRRSRPSPWPGLPQARAAAAADGDHYVGTQHLLVALLMRPGGPARQALALAGIELAEVRTVLAARHGPGPPPAPGNAAEVQLGRRAAAILDAAARARAELLGDGQVRDDDVLDALLASADPATAHTILRYLSVDAHHAARIRRRLASQDDCSLVGTNPPPALRRPGHRFASRVLPGPTGAHHRWMCRQGDSPPLLAASYPARCPRFARSAIESRLPGGAVVAVARARGGGCGTQSLRAAGREL